MWTAKTYQSVSTCTEEFYTFSPSEAGVSLLEDQALMIKCGVYKRPSINVINSSRTSNKPPDVVTKCGSQTPSLISFRRSISHTPEITNTNSIHRPTPQNNHTPGVISGNLVPNIVHYISVGTWNFTFLNYLSFRSVHTHIKCDYILVHGDGLPHGIWWNRTLDETPNIYHVYRKRPIRIQGRKVRWLEHSTDIMRLQTILGIFSTVTHCNIYKSMYRVNQMDIGI